MPNNLTDNEIKKALECLAYHKECPESDMCPYYMDNGDICDNISLAKNALDLINRKKFRIHKQEKTIMEIQNANLIDFKATIGNYIAENENLKAEVERLKVDIALYKSVKKIVLPDITDKGIEFKEYEPLFQKIKAEAYKEFANKSTDKVEKARQKYERLCKEQGEEMEEHMHIHFNGIIKIIKDLLNELVGDADGEGN